MPDDTLQLGIRVLRHHLSEVGSHDPRQQRLVDEDPTFQPLSMAPVIATANSCQALAFGQKERIPGERD
jgi:hypothetical protein